MTARAVCSIGLIATAISFAGIAPVHAQEADHSQHHVPAGRADDHESGTPPTEATEDEHASHGQHAAHSTAKGDDKPRTPIPVLTDADRAAAFPLDADHPVHDQSLHYFVLFDRLELTDADDGRGSAWEAQGWFGGDMERLWVRSEGERLEDETVHADIELLYGRSVSTWWDVVGGIRHDFGAGPSQTFAAFGVQGLSPYKFEIEATAYLGESGQTAASLEAEYDTLITSRLILQWQAEAGFYGKDDPERGIGGGLDTLEAGVRLRYEIRREFAPYIGLEWERRFGEAAELREALGEDATEMRLVLGVRTWF